MDTRKEAIRRSEHWWFCENMVNHPGQIALLKMDFPRVFVLIDDYGSSFTTYDNFAENVACVNFFDPGDREDADLDDILTDAWNFLSLEEEMEERIAEQHNYYQEEDE